MKVKELIEALSKQDPEAEVLVEDNDGVHGVYEIRIEHIDSSGYLQDDGTPCVVIGMP